MRPSLVFFMFFIEQNFFFCFLRMPFGAKCSLFCSKLLLFTSSAIKLAIFWWLGQIHIFPRKSSWKIQSTLTSKYSIKEPLVNLIIVRYYENLFLFGLAFQCSSVIFCAKYWNWSVFNQLPRFIDWGIFRGLIFSMRAILQASKRSLFFLKCSLFLPSSAQASQPFPSWGLR